MARYDSYFPLGGGTVPAWYALKERGFWATAAATAKEFYERGKRGEDVEQAALGVWRENPGEVRKALAEKQKGHAKVGSTRGMAELLAERGRGPARERPPIPELGRPPARHPSREDLDDHSMALKMADVPFSIWPMMDMGMAGDYLYRTQGEMLSQQQDWMRQAETRARSTDTAESCARLALYRFSRSAFWRHCSLHGCCGEPR